MTAKRQSPAPPWASGDRAYCESVELDADFRKDNPTAPFIQHRRGLRHVGDVAAQIVADLQRQRCATHLHDLGARPVLEALLELDAGRDLDDVLARYAELDPEIVRALGADRFPPLPLRRVA